jgi:hypothetical protein
MTLDQLIHEEAKRDTDGNILTTAKTLRDANKPSYELVHAGNTMYAGNIHCVNGDVTVNQSEAPKIYAVHRGQIMPVLASKTATNTNVVAYGDRFKTLVTGDAYEERDTLHIEPDVNHLADTELYSASQINPSVQNGFTRYLTKKDL